MIPELSNINACMCKNRRCSFNNFWRFSAESISGRVNDCESEYIITADEGVRGGKTIPLKSNN